MYGLNVSLAVHILTGVYRATFLISFFFLRMALWAGKVAERRGPFGRISMKILEISAFKASASAKLAANWFKL